MIRRKPEWYEWTQLYDAVGCRLESIPGELLTKYKDAKVIYLYGNKISELSDYHIKHWNHVTWLNLGGNNLSSLPERIGELQTLTGLLVYANPLKSLPRSLMDLPNLETFWCDPVPGVLDRVVRIGKNRQEIIELWKEIFTGQYMK